MEPRIGGSRLIAETLLEIYLSDLKELNIRPKSWFLTPLSLQSLSVKIACNDIGDWKIRSCDESSFIASVYLGRVTLGLGPGHESQTMASGLNVSPSCSAATHSP